MARFGARPIPSVVVRLFLLLSCVMGLVSGWKNRWKDIERRLSLFVFIQFKYFMKQMPQWGEETG